MSMDNKPGLPEVQKKELQAYNERALQAQRMVDDVVLKKYLTRLEKADVVPFPKELKPEKGDIRLFKINKMVYEKDEYATDKFISMVGSMTFAANTVFLIVDGHKDRTDFYLGVKSDKFDERRTGESVGETFRRSITGQFPGAGIKDCSAERGDLFKRFAESVAISSCVGLPAEKNESAQYNNANYIQGIEKLALAMQGKEYTAIILATCHAPEEIAALKSGYETIYSELSTESTQQIAYSTNESLANSITRTKGYSDSKSVGTAVAVGKSTTETETHTDGESKANAAGKAAKLMSSLSGPVMVAGAALAVTGVGTIPGAILMGLGAAAKVAAPVTSAFEKQISSSDSTSKGKTNSITNTKSNTDTHTETFSDSEGQTSTIGTTKNFSLTIQNKHIQETLKLIDKQLERIEKSEGLGLWSGGAYFLSYDMDNAGAEVAASIYRSILQGERSGVEVSAINTWRKSDNQIESLREYLSFFSHPLFSYGQNGIQMTSSSLVNSRELAMMIGLPRKSVPGLPVVDHVSLAKEVVRFPSLEDRREFEFGHVYDQGIEKNQFVNLDLKSLTKHVFVTGSTGCGKSETVYSLIQKVREKDSSIHFLVIEPAKGEYRNVFGNVNIYGTNPKKAKLLKINPFRFPSKEVHVLEHIDRLVEIFNVCWPMYAAMPAVLKEAILSSYEKCGWDLALSESCYSNDLFPTFADLQNELVTVINQSDYSAEVKSNYTGSLVTRVKSLTNGINGQIFCGSEVGDSELFDKDVIVDLSRVGSQETKALIMGLLVTRLSEYRASTAGEPNSNLRHLTILEEAHNILKRCSQEQSMEGSNVAGKAVEMLSNSIAEMRTYGEGFIIVDQSPNAVDISAIRNTNTKIIMRLPEENDRRVTGKSAAMKDDQLDEIAILPTGVAVVYQNDWESPVLCKIERFDGQRIKDKTKVNDIFISESAFLSETMKFLLAERCKLPGGFNLERLKDLMASSSCPTACKIQLYKAIKEYNERHSVTLWESSHYGRLSTLITSILSVRQEVIRYARTERSFPALTNALKRLVESRMPDLPSVYTRRVIGCLMMDYGQGSDLRSKLSKKWAQSYV